MTDVSAIIEQMRQQRKMHAGAQPSSMHLAIQRERQEERDAERRAARQRRLKITWYFADKRRRREARHQCHDILSLAYFTARSRYWRPG